MSKAWHQLDYAYANACDQIWIFNVGDIKPMEVPLSWAMMKAWNTNTLEPSQLPMFFDAFVSNNFFGLRPEDEEECSRLLFEYDQLMGLGKHECIEDDTFSAMYYDEADIVLQKWSDLLGRATRIHERASMELKPAVYQLILHPIKATQIYIALRVALGKNKLYALQRRTIANKYAKEVLRLFDADFDLSTEYHELLGGKWNHMMDTPHYGNRWDQDIAPFRDMVPGLCYVQTRQKASHIVGCMGVAVEGHPGYRSGLCCEEHELTRPSRAERIPSVTTSPLEPLGSASRWFELYSHSTEQVHWTAKIISTGADWLNITKSTGFLQPEDEATRVYVFVADWSAVPESYNDEALIEIKSDQGDFEHVHVPIIKRPPPETFHGSVESDRHVSISATNFDKSTSGTYTINKYIGRTGAGGALLAQPPFDPDALDFLEYSFFTYTHAPDATVTLYFTMTFNTDPKNPLRYDIRLDDDVSSAVASTSHRLVPDAPRPGELPPGDLPHGWMEECPRLVWTRTHPIDLSQAGAHTVKVRLRNANCILEKVVVDLGGVHPSYLGPPVSKTV